MCSCYDVRMSTDDLFGFRLFFFWFFFWNNFHLVSVLLHFYFNKFLFCFNLTASKFYFDSNELKTNEWRKRGFSSYKKKKKHEISKLSCFDSMIFRLRGKSGKSSCFEWILGYKRFDVNFKLGQWFCEGFLAAQVSWQVEKEV